MALAKRNLRKLTWEPFREAAERWRTWTTTCGRVARPAPLRAAGWQAKERNSRGAHSSSYVTSKYRNKNPTLAGYASDCRPAHYSHKHTRVRFKCQPVADLCSRCEQTLDTFVLPPGSGEWVNFGVTSESLNTTWDTRFEFGYSIFTSDWIFCNEGTCQKRNISITAIFNFKKIRIFEWYTKYEFLSLYISGGIYGELILSLR